MQEALGIKDESAFRAASGLHAGMGRGDVCGSLMGASLMIGLVCGKSIEESGQPKEHTGPPWGAPTRLVGEIYDWFEKEFGSVKCRDVRGKYDEEVKVEAGGKKLTDKEMIDRVHVKCDELTRKTAARTVELLWGEIKK